MLGISDSFEFILAEPILLHLLVALLSYNGNASLLVAFQLIGSFEAPHEKNEKHVSPTYLTLEKAYVPTVVTVPVTAAVTALILESCYLDYEISRSYSKARLYARLCYGTYFAD